MEDKIHQAPLNMKARALTWKIAKGFGERCDWWTCLLRILLPLPVALALLQEKALGDLEL